MELLAVSIRISGKKNSSGQSSHGSGVRGCGVSAGRGAPAYRAGRLPARLKTEHPSPFEECILVYLSTFQNYIECFLCL